MKVTKYVERAPQHVLVFGDGGTGKSTLASQLAARGFRLKWISCDNGHNILLKLPKEAQEQIDLIVLPDVRDYQVAVDAFRAITARPYKAVKICDRHGKVNCSGCLKDHPEEFSQVDLSSFTPQDILVWDNLSQLSDSYMNLITKGKAIDYKLQLDDWGALSFHLKAALTEIQQFPFNFVGIAHAVEEKITDGANKIMPMVGSSQFAPKVTGYFDHAVYCSVMNRSHRAGSSTTYMLNVLTKSRTDKAIEKLPELSLLPFFDGSIQPEQKHGEQHVSSTLKVATSAAQPNVAASAGAGKVPVVVNSPVPVGSKSPATDGNTVNNKDGAQPVPGKVPVVVAAPVVTAATAAPVDPVAGEDKKALTPSERARLALKGLGR